MRQFKAAQLVGNGTGERSLFVPKKLTLQQLLGYGSAVDGNEVAGGAVRQIVQRTRHDLLAGTTLSCNQDRGTGNGHHWKNLAQSPYRVTLSDKRQ